MKDKITIALAKMSGTAIARQYNRTAWFLVLVIGMIAGLGTGDVTYRELVSNVIRGKSVRS